MSNFTKPQIAMLEKAAVNDVVRPFHGEWNTAYNLARRGLLQTIVDHEGQRYRITDAGRKALIEETK